MTTWACIDTLTNTIRHFQDFRDDEKLPVDLPHKHLIWRPVREIHGEFDPATEQEQGSTLDITDTEVIITHMILLKPIPTPEQIQSQRQRATQSAFFSSDKRPLTMLVFELYNEIRVLKGEEPLVLDDFKKVLQHYAT